MSGMKTTITSIFALFFSLLFIPEAYAQEEAEDDEIDWDAYGEVEYVGGQSI